MIKKLHVERSINMDFDYYFFAFITSVINASIIILVVIKTKKLVEERKIKLKNLEENIIRLEKRIRG